MNNGQGFFSDSAQALGSGTTRGGALGDVDGDGDLDALLGKDGQPDEVWLNNGAGQFTDSGQRLGNARVFDLVVGDVDGDGDLDFTRQMRILRQTACGLMMAWAILCLAARR